MGLKKRSKVSAEFSMSSLTDIIFLLLIFFMLTSNFVKIDPFDLPESNSKAVAPTNLVVQIEKSGKVTLNNRKVSLTRMTSAVRNEMKKQDVKRKDASLTIVAEVGVPFKKVQKVIETAGKLRIKAILATQAN